MRRDCPSGLFKSKGKLSSNMVLGQKFRSEIWEALGGRKGSGGESE